MNQLNQSNQPNIPQRPQPNFQPEIPQKSKLPTWAFVLIVAIAAIIVVGLVSYGVHQYFTPQPKPAEPLTIEEKLTEEQPITTVPSIQVHKDYKKIISLSFDYGSGEQQFGIIRVAGGSGPSSFCTDNRNYLYITDFRNRRIKKFNSEGKQLSVINTGQSLVDIAVDKDGNIYGYAYGPGYPGIHLFKYDSNGSLLGKIENPTAFSKIFSSKSAYGNLYIVGGKLYITDSQQNSYLISPTEGTFKSETPTKTDGIYGYSGKRYKTNLIERNKKGLVDIINQSGVKENTIIVEVDGLASIVFLGEDQDGNIYIQTEIGNKGKIGMKKLEVRKYDPRGNLLTTLDIPNTEYSIWTVKLLHVDRTGDIWQVIPGKNKLFVNRWSTTY